MQIAPDQLSEYLGATALAVAGLGAASYGVVDGLKIFPWIALAGFRSLFAGRNPKASSATLNPLLPALERAYGEAALTFLKAQYRSTRVSGDLPRTLRQGVRIGIGMMAKEEIESLAVRIGLDRVAAKKAGDALLAAQAVRPPATGDATPPVLPTIDMEQRSAAAQLETAIDARIDAALGLADARYITLTRIYAMVVALAIAIAVGGALGVHWLTSLIVGIAAVPIAPVGKDLASALEHAVRALKAQ